MTTIVAIEGKGWSVVGWDSRVVDDGGRAYVAGNGWSKVVKNNGFLIGVAGDVRAINLVHHVFHPPKADGLTGIKLDKFITAKFIPALRECFEREGYMGVNRRDNAEEHGSEILVSVNATVFEIGTDWAWVREACGRYAIGTGGGYSLGGLVLADCSTQERAQQSVLASLKVSARFDSATAAPFHTASQSVVV
jgi:ATP-dependent protease HslVU (ClpYQ) peptidase subunit